MKSIKSLRSGMKAASDAKIRGYANGGGVSGDPMGPAMGGDASGAPAGGKGKKSPLVNVTVLTLQKDKDPMGMPMPPPMPVGGPMPPPPGAGPGGPPPGGPPMPAPNMPMPPGGPGGPPMMRASGGRVNKAFGGEVPDFKADVGVPAVKAPKVTKPIGAKEMKSKGVKKDMFKSMVETGKAKAKAEAKPNPFAKPGASVSAKPFASGGKVLKPSTGGAGGGLGRLAKARAYKKGG